MAKKVVADRIVKAVKTTQKNVRYFAKIDGKFTPVTRKVATETLKSEGLRISDAIKAINTIRENPFTMVKETKRGLTFAR